MTQTLANTYDNYMASLPQDKVVAQAHANLAKGQVVQIAIATGITSAPGAADRLGYFGVALDAIASGARGRFAVDGFAQITSGAAVTLGALCDASADMFIDPLAEQTDGNGIFRALETASGAAELIWCKFL